MEDVLIVAFDKDPYDADDTVIMISRQNNEKMEIVKVKYGEQAEILYKLLTDQTLRAAIAEDKK